MCDIYDHECNKKDCTDKFDMHLEDFATGRDEIEVFCEFHIPKDKSSGVLWRYRDCDQKNWNKMFVKCLTENAKNHWEGNCFNGECESLMVFGRPGQQY